MSSPGEIWRGSRRSFQQIPLNDILSATTPSTAGYHGDGYDSKGVGAGHVRRKDTELVRMARLDVNTGWTPFFLKKTTLAGFVCFFIAALAALEGMYRRSIINQGLATQEDRNHYLWTYGPTAVFIIILSFFAQVDYRVRELTPWAALASGPVPASKSLLADYNSPFLLVALLAAVRNRHYMPVLTMTGYLALKLISIFSTGLFILQPQDLVDFSAPFLVSDNFSIGTASFAVPADDATVRYNVYGNLALNLSYAADTTPQYAVQTFSSPNQSGYSNIKSINALVDVFTANLVDCEVGTLAFIGYSENTTLTPAPAYPFAAEEPTFVFNSPSGCQFEVPTFSWDSNNGTRYYGLGGGYNCTNLVESEGEDAFRFATVLVQQVMSEIQNISCIICKPSYSIQQAHVTTIGNGSEASGTGMTIEPVQSSANRTLGAVSQTDYLEGVMASLALDSFDDTSGTAFPTEEGTYIDGFWTLLLVQEKNIDISAYLDPKMLETYSRQLYTSVAVQLAKKYLTLPSNFELRGTAIYYEQRLFVRVLSLRLMQASLVIMMCVTGLLIWKCPRGVVSRDPNTIGGLATILAASPHLQEKLRHKGPSGDATTKSTLMGNLYHSVIYESAGGIPSFTIEASNPGETFGNKAPSSTISNDGIELSNLQGNGVVQDASISRLSPWWRPQVLRLPAAVAGLILPLALVVVLEIVLHISQKGSGIADIDIGSTNDSIHYLWVYFPAFVMFIVSSLFHAFQFAIITVQPYHVLRTGGASAASSILFNSRGNFSLLVFFNSIKMGHIAVLTSSLAALLVPFLTIVVSGLYTSNTVPYTHEIGVKQLDWFNASWNQQDNQTDDIAISLVVAGTLSYPPGTYEELVFPFFEVANSSGSGKELFYLTQATSMSVQVPAIRGNMNCTNVPTNQYLNISVTSDTSDFGPEIIGLVNYDDGGTSGEPDFRIPATGGYMGNLIDVSGKKADGTNYFTSLGVIYGHVLNDSHLTHNFTTLRCYPYVEQVSSKTSVLLPSLSIDTTQLPIIDNSTAKFFSNARLSEFYIDGVEDLLHTNLTVPGALGPFLRQLLEYNSTLTPSDLMDANVLIDALQHQYRLYVAQVLNANIRMPVTNMPPLNGTFTDSNRLRLQQNILSTRLLQAILAVSTICGIIAYVCVDTDRLLPEEPGSIAAVFSLLAGHEIVTRKIIREGSEWALTSHPWWDGWVFSLGWWNDGQQGKRFGIDVGRSDRE